MKSLDDFIKKYQDEKVGFPAGKYVGQCLSLVKWYIEECFEIPAPPSGVNAAYGYWTNFPDPLGSVFEKIKNTPDGVPKKGDIVIWSKNTGGGFGHIAIFVEGNTSSFRSFDQNWPLGTKCHVQGHYYNNVLGWLRPKEESMDDDPLLKEIYEHFKVKDNQELFKKIDEELEHLANARETVPKLRELTETQEQEIERLRGELKNFKEDYKREKSTFEAREKEKDKRHQDFVASLADSLSVKQNEEEIVAAVKRLLEVEEQLRKERGDHWNTQNHLKQNESLVARIFEAVAKISGLSVSSEKGFLRALERVSAPKEDEEVSNMAKEKYSLKLAVVKRFLRVVLPQLPAVVAFMTNFGPAWLPPVLVFVGAVLTAFDKMARELKWY